MRIRRRLLGFIAIIQSVLLLAHLFLYETWEFSLAGSDTHSSLWIKLVLGFLSVSFVAASLLAFLYTNAALRALYRVAAIWMGLLTFLIFAAVSSWMIFGVARLVGFDMNFHRTVELLFGCAVVAGTLRGIQRKLDANHANDSAARELAGSVARAKGGADQRSAPRARAKRQFSPAHSSEDFEGGTGRDLLPGDLYDGTAIDAGRSSRAIERPDGATRRVFCCGKSRAI